MFLSTKTKGILTIIGGFIIHIVHIKNLLQINGSIYSWGNLNTYLISYLKIFNPEYTIEEGFFFTPFGILASTSFIAIGGYLETKLGPRL